MPRALRHEYPGAVYHLMAREYLEDVLARLPAMKDREVATLIPANLLRAGQSKSVPKAA